MSESLLVTLDRTIAQAIEAALVNQGLRSPGGVFLNREEPVGENEQLPIVKIYTGRSVETRDEAHLFSTHRRQITIQIFAYVPPRVDINSPDVTTVLDPLHQCVRNAILQTGPIVAGVQLLIAPATMEPPALEGTLGMGEYVYNVQQVTRQTDLGATV